MLFLATKPAGAAASAHCCATVFRFNAFPGRRNFASFGHFRWRPTDSSRAVDPSAGGQSAGGGTTAATATHHHIGATEWGNGKRSGRKPNRRFYGILCGATTTTHLLIELVVDAPKYSTISQFTHV